MSTKPSAIPTWATNALDLLLAPTKVQPPTLKQQSGFAGGERPPASHLNWLLNNLYLWAEYLRDGALQGAHTFNSTVGITGLLSSAAITAAGLITANAGVTAASGQHVTVAGAGFFKHGIKTMSLSPHQLLAYGAAVAPVSLQGGASADFATNLVASAQSLQAALAINGLQTGQRIVNMRVYFKDVNAQAAVTASLRCGDRAGSSAVNAVTAVSANNGTTQTLTLTALNHTIGTTGNGPVWLRLSTAVNVTGTYQLYAVEIDYDCP